MIGSPPAGRRLSPTSSSSPVSSIGPGSSHPGGLRSAPVAPPVVPPGPPPDTSPRPAPPVARPPPGPAPAPGAPGGAPAGDLDADGPAVLGLLLAGHERALLAIAILGHDQSLPDQRCRDLTPRNPWRAG